MNDVIGIDKERLKTIIINIYEYRDKINTILNDAQYLIEETKQYYKSEDGDYLRKKFSQFYDNKLIILENIKSYCNDLEQVISDFESSQINVVDIFKK